MTTPDHLTPIEPASAVHELCDRPAAQIPVRGYYGVMAELSAFRDTRAPWDGRRVANALRHVLKRSDLAAEVEGLLPPLPRPADLAGVLQMQPSGRWAICIPGQAPIEITSGEVFRLEVEGREGLQLTRMEHAPAEGYYSVDGYLLSDGLRAALGDGGD